jgi:hypothetical protein
LGANVKLAYANYRYDGETWWNETLWGLGPFARYYIRTNSVLPFVEFSSAFGQLWIDDVDPLMAISLAGNAGVAVPLGDKATFDAALGYQMTTLKQREDNEYNERQKFGTVGIHLGVTVMLGNK